MITKNFLFTACFILFTCLNSLSQISIDDPLTVIKDPQGNKLSRSDIEKIMDEGKRFSLSAPTKIGDTTIYLMNIISKEKVAEIDSLRSAKKSSLVNKPIKPFTLIDLNGNEISEGSLKGKVTVMNFWFTGCKPCIREMPDLNKLAEKYNEEVNFIAPALDSKSDIQEFLSKKTFKYEIIPEADTFNKEMGITIYPTHLIIDEEGIVREVIVGAKDIYDQIESRLKRLLE